MAWAGAGAGALSPWAHAEGAASWEDQAWLDPARDRTLPVRVRWPVGTAPCGVVIFSHGLGGNRNGGGLWAAAWQSVGFAVVNLQHPGSDSEIWRGGTAAVRRAASAEQYIERVVDAHFVLDELARRQRTEPAWQRLRVDAIGFCGHSFGARLTQAIAGELPVGALRRARARGMRDARPRAFIAFSPGFGASEGTTDADVATRFGQIERPFLCVTGTLDDAMIVGDASNATRRAVYRGLPAGNKAELLLAGADHMTFGGQATPANSGAVLRREVGAAQLEPGHRSVVASVTSDWWRWRLLGDEAARARLLAPIGLSSGDTWQQA
jgi:predicted dienelactone hydrolase